MIIFGPDGHVYTFTRVLVDVYANRLVALDWGRVKVRFSSIDSPLLHYLGAYETDSFQKGMNDLDMEFTILCTKQTW